MKKKVVSAFFAGIFLVWMTLGATACSRQPQGAQSYFALGTVCNVNAYDDGSEAFYEAVGHLLNEIEAVFDVHNPESEVSRLNAAAGGAPVTVSEELFFVLEKALFFARETHGAFDPTVGPVVALWGISTDHPRVPTEEEIEALLPFVDYRTVEVDTVTREVSLPAGVGLDFGGIAKGYAADRIASLLAKHKVRQGIIDLGGNIYVYGTKKDGSMWRVGVKDPEDSQGSPALRLEIAGSRTVVTSGAYERFFEEEGRIYHHIIDPKTGKPSDAGLTSATIVANSSLAADALSTACYVLGRDEAAHLFPQGFSKDDVSADMVLIDQDKRLWATPGLRDAVAVLTEDYRF
jgi:thiamine biosynthesis lipoprotein